MNEKARFAERLKSAMLAAGYEARPGVLLKQFNTRYWGRSVSFQGARRWLMGMSIPQQEKLQVLAEWLGLEPQALRFGDHAVSKTRTKRVAWPGAISDQDRAAIEALLALPAHRRKLINELIKTLTPEGRSQ